MNVFLLKSLSDGYSESEEDPYVKVLSVNGFVPQLLETLDFSLLPENLTAYANWQETFSCIIFTSQRAVRAFQKAGLRGKTADLCFVVGPATAECAKGANFSPKGADSGNAEALSKYILNNHISELKKPALFLAGETHRDFLPNALDKQGIKVVTVIAYSAKPNPELHNRLRLSLCEGRNNAQFLVYFSPSAIAITETILKSEIGLHQPKLKVVAMGPSTAAHLEDLGVVVAGVAPSPKPSSLLALLENLAAKSLREPVSAAS